MNKRALFLLPLLAGCSLAPDFEPPSFDLPGVFRQSPPPDLSELKGEWKEAAPMEAADRGRWWSVFGDPALDALEEKAAKASPTLQAAAARVETARASVRAEASTLFPKVTIGANAVRSQPGSAGMVAFGGTPGAQMSPYTLYSAGGQASYEVDLFGRVRDNEKALEADARAQEALYRSTLLMLQADVAQEYFTLRMLDAERALLRHTVDIRSKAMDIMQKRFDVGEAGEQDLTRSQAELASAQAELAAAEHNRNAHEYALAVLVGDLPSNFIFVDSPLEPEAAPPVIPPGVPGLLLLRRPDVAAAHEAMAAANARIGVARTAFFPQLILTASGGFESTTLSDLFLWSSRTWALGQVAGQALSMTVFDSGRNLARLDAADARYDETVAGYRAQVLLALRDVETALSAQRWLAEQSLAQDAAATAAARTTELSQLRYDEGETSYFEVVDAQRNSLAAGRGAVQTRGARFLATIGLIRALGGGWE